MSERSWQARMLAMVCLYVGLWWAGALVAFHSQASEHENLVIAHIDGQPVTGGAFAPYLRAYLRSKLYHEGSPERVRTLADEAIEAFLIDRVLANQAAARQLKIDEGVVEKRLAGIKARFSNRPEWLEIRARMPKLREEIEKDLRIEALKSEISRTESPTDADVRAFYEKRSELFIRPAAYRLRLLLIAVDPGAGSDAWHAAEKRAQEFVGKIALGEEFAALARRNSKHSSAEQGGAIGLVHEGQLGEAAEAAVRATEPGGITGPVRLLEGIAVFKVEEKRLSALMPFQEVKERASLLLVRDRAKKQWEDYIETIRGQFSINKSAFAAFLANAVR